MMVSLPQVSREDRFEEAVVKLKERLYVHLNGLLQRYSNECHTPYLPQNLDFFEFTLAYPTPFSLRIVKSVADLSVKFYERQGILEPSLLESAADRQDPFRPGAAGSCVIICLRQT